MKKRFLIVLLFSATLSAPAAAKQICLDISDQDIAVAENDVVDAEQWIKDAWAGKLSKSKSRMIKAEVERSINGGETLPAGEAAIIEKAFNRPDYKSRKEREAALKQLSR